MRIPLYLFTCVQLCLFTGKNILSKNKGSEIFNFIPYTFSSLDITFLFFLLNKLASYLLFQLFINKLVVCI